MEGALLVDLRLPCRIRGSTSGGRAYSPHVLYLASAAILRLPGRLSDLSPVMPVEAGRFRPRASIPRATWSRVAPYVATPDVKTRSCGSR